jgi:hypothetical protein
MSFLPGDYVVRTPEHSGGPIGIGLVVKPPYPVAPGWVDVRWISGRRLELVDYLRLATEDEIEAHTGSPP